MVKQLLIICDKEEEFVTILNLLHTEIYQNMEKVKIALNEQIDEILEEFSSEKNYHEWRKIWRENKK